MDFTTFAIIFGGGVVTGVLWVLAIIGCRRLEDWCQRQLKAHAKAQEEAGAAKANACRCQQAEGEEHR